MTEPREWWVWKSKCSTYAYGRDPSPQCPGNIHVIEKSAYDKLLEARKSLRSALHSIQNEDLLSAESIVYEALKAGDGRFKE